jgi:trans-aconitate methyltransferase
VLELVGTDAEDAALEEQLEYYRNRAVEYERSLRYDDSEVRDRFSQILDWLGPRGATLELACGTGLWTELLALRVPKLVAVDGAPEMLEQARARPVLAGVQFQLADLFHWRSDETYDSVFFAFWLSHVPPSRFEEFWGTLREALAPGGQVLFVDTGPKEAHYEQFVAGAEMPSAERTLRDGRRYRVVKVLREPESLRMELANLGFAAEIQGIGAPRSFHDGTLIAGRAVSLT